MIVMEPPAAENAATRVDWRERAERVISGESLTRAEARQILAVDDVEILGLLDAAFLLRRHNFGTEMKLNMLVNAKSGLCPEDCNYCSQARGADTGIDRYPLLDKDTLVAGAREARDRGASTYCIVASGRGPTPKELTHVTDAVREIKQEMPIRICACLGLLKEGQADQLKDAGVDRYNHNINTSRRHHEAIVSTHTYDDRVETVNDAKSVGISPCSGAIVGMGETDDDRVDMAFELHAMGAESIPINFLIPIAGTPMGDQAPLTPYDCLRILAMFRFVCPDRELRVAGGREIRLRSLQPLALFAANSIFLGDYLTTDGQDSQQDRDMIDDLGFGLEEVGSCSGGGSCGSGGCSS